MKIAPSMLACNFSEMGNEIKKITKAGADLVHMDVMDGTFVSNISFGADIIKSLRGLTHLPFDVHLMILDPLVYLDKFAAAGADSITFHVESESDPFITIKEIQKLNKKVGISLKPDTDITEILPFLPFVDIVLVMTVEPGFGGQDFLMNQLAKIEKLRNIIDSNRFRCVIEVDGGINYDTIKHAKKFGADICVAGTSLFRAENICEAIQKMQNC